MFAPFGHVVDVRWVDLNCNEKLDEPTSSTAKFAEKEASELYAKSADSEDSTYCKGAEIEFENESYVQNLLGNAGKLLLTASLKPDSVCIGLKSILIRIERINNLTKV